MKLDCLPSYSQFNKAKEKNNLTNKQYNMGHKGAFIVTSSLHV